MLLAELVVPSFLIARNFLKKKKDELAARIDKDKADKAVTDAIEISDSKKSSYSNKYYHNDGHHHHRHKHHSKLENDANDINDEKIRGVKKNKKILKINMVTDSLLVRWHYMWISLIIGFIIVITLIINRSNV